MTEKIGELLFHPSTLINYKDTKFYKILLYLLLLTLLTSIVPIIESFKFSGYSYADKKLFEDFIDFSNVSHLPNCKLENNKLNCVNLNEVKEIAKVGTIFTVVVDMNNKMTQKSPNQLYIRLTENNVKISDNMINYAIINYNELPASWQTLDFEKIKSEKYPEEAYFDFFINGLNELREEYLVYEMIAKIISIFFLIIFEVVFYSFIFYLIIGRKIYKYREVFKVALFAYTLPVVIGLFFSLMDMQVLNSTLLAIITIMYLHIALIPKEKMSEDDN